MSDVSVIIPVYNGARFLAETLSSIQAQTVPLREVVVVDDGSSDDSVAIANSHPVVSCVVKTKRNMGVCHARNVGIASTTGDLIAFCDQDDLWAPGKVRAQVDAFGRHANVDFLFANFQERRGDDLDPILKFDSAPIGWWAGVVQSSGLGVSILVHPALPHLLKFQPVFPSTVMIRRSLLDRSGPFDETLGREQSEDLEFLLRCDLLCLIAALDEPLVTIRKHGGNYSTDNTKTTVSQIRILRAMLRHEGPVGGYAAYKREIEEQLRLRSIDVIDGAFASGDLETCRAIARDSPDWGRDLKLRIKIAIASLPAPVGRRLQALVVRHGE